MIKSTARARVRVLTTAAGICLATLAAPAAAGAANPWLTPPNQFLNMAHQGGELEAPGNTLYAFKTAMRDRGADAIEMDAYITQDGVLVVNHDRTVTDTTDFGQATAASPFDNPATSSQIWDHTLAELKTLDAAYKFSPGKGEYGYDPADPHPFRGIATGDVAPPSGYTANDFTIPTFEEVLAAFPNTKINIDIKHQSGLPGDIGTTRGVEAAQGLAEILQAQPGGDNENVMVASFGDAEIEAFNAAMPEHLSISGSLPATEGYVLSNPYEPFVPEVQAIQPPDKYVISGTEVDAPEVIKAVMDGRGDQYAIHVWGADGTSEDDALYRRLVDAGVQGFFPQNSTELATFLCANRVPDASGIPRCTPPAAPLGPLARLGPLGSPKGKVKAGRPATIRGSVVNGGDQALTGARACVGIGKRLRRELKSRCVEIGDVAPGETASFALKVRTSKQAKGRYRLAVEVTSDNGGLQQGTAALRIKPAKKKGK